MAAKIMQRIGAPVCDLTLGQRCPLCKKPDPFITAAGGHAFCCDQPGAGGAKGGRGRRHAHVLHVLSDAMESVSKYAAKVKREPPLKDVPGWSVKAGAEGSPAATLDGPRGDILFYVQSANKHIVGDLIITHPRVDRTPACANTDGAAADKAYDAKLASYKARFNFPERGFVPLAMETGGRMHPSFRDYIRKFILYYLGTDKYDGLEKEQRANYSKHVRHIITSVSVAAARTTGLSLLYLKDACAAARAPPGVEALPTQLATPVVIAASGASGEQAAGGAPLAAADD